MELTTLVVVLLVCVFGRKVYDAVTRELYQMVRCEKEANCSDRNCSYWHRHSFCTCGDESCRLRHAKWCEMQKQMDCTSTSCSFRHKALVDCTFCHQLQNPYRFNQVSRACMHRDQICQECILKSLASQLNNNVAFTCCHPRCDQLLDHSDLIRLAHSKPDFLVEVFRKEFSQTNSNPPHSKLGTSKVQPRKRGSSMLTKMSAYLFSPTISNKHEKQSIRSHNTMPSLPPLHQT